MQPVRTVRGTRFIRGLLQGYNSRFGSHDILPLLGCAVPGIKPQQEFPHLLPQRRNDALGDQNQALEPLHKPTTLNIYIIMLNTVYSTAYKGVITLKKIKVYIKSLSQQSLQLVTVY